MRPRSVPKPITRKGLEHAALRYLERYAASTELLRRVLMRKVQRAVRAGVAQREEAVPLVEALLHRLTGQGLLDDGKFAVARARSDHARGRSRSFVAQALAQRGVGREQIGAALAALAEESSDPDLEAALAFARRRRLGPYRAAEERAARRAKDLAALARAGFPMDVARKVLDAPDPEALRAEIARR